LYLVNKTSKRVVRRWEWSYSVTYDAQGEPEWDVNVDEPTEVQ
jgi:hypothetical protein